MAVHLHGILVNLYTMVFSLLSSRHSSSIPVALVVDLDNSQLVSVWRDDYVE